MATLTRSTTSLNRLDSGSFLDLNQYKRAIKRLEAGHQSLSDVAQALKDRAVIEQQYSTALKKWADKYGSIFTKGGEYNTTREACVDLLAEARGVADIHETCSQSLVGQTQKKIKSWQKDHYHTKITGGFKEVNSCEKEFKKAQKPWEMLLRAQKKAKDGYYDACKQQRSAEQSLQNMTMDLENAKREGKDETAYNQKIGKQKIQLTKKEEAVVATREKYKAAVNKCTQEKDKYVDDVKTVYEKTQLDEANRLKFVREIFFDFHQRVNISTSQAFKSIYETHEVALNKLNYEADLAWWHNTNGMGVQMQWPSFEDYDPEAALNTVAHNQNQRASKHVAIDNQIQGTGYRSTLQNPPSFNNTFQEEFHEPVHTYDKPPQQIPQAGDHEDTYNNNKPMSIQAAESITVEAIYEYHAQESDEINLAVGQRLVRLEDEDSQGWCRGRADDGKEGLFPANYVRVV